MRRFGFFWYDSLDETFYVEVEDDIDLLAAFKQQWTAWIEKLKTYSQNKSEEFTTAEEKLAEKYTLREVGDGAIKWSPRPVCCAAISKETEYDFDKGPPVQLRVYKMNPDRMKSDYLIEPRWVIRSVGFEVCFCPFCGANLPGVELMENPPHPIHDDSYGEGYCGTCSERSMCCECNPPWTAYRIKS